MAEEPILAALSSAVADVLMCCDPLEGRKEAVVTSSRAMEDLRRAFEVYIDREIERENTPQ